MNQQLYKNIDREVIIMEAEANTELLKSFPPVVNTETKILVLGSMPGRESLRKQEYYAHKRNHFWPIMAELFGLEASLPYEQRLALLLAQGVGLWDVLDSCVREGSLDSGIRQGMVHDFAGLFEQYLSIRWVLFNGSKSYDIFRKEVGFSRFNSIHFRKMPSTSPANTKAFDFKLKEWSNIKEYLRCKEH